MVSIRVVLFDFDGVIRRFSTDFDAQCEQKYGVPIGSIQSVAFAEPLITELTSGQIRRAEWLERIGEGIGSTEAALAWGQQPTYADAELLAFVDELRASGLITAVLTNGTDEVRDEAAALGVTELFDAFFNSAEIGFTKPDPRAFQHVLDELSVDGPQVFFTDDSHRKLAGATELGMTVHHYTALPELKEALSRVQCERGVT